MMQLRKDGTNQFSVLYLLIVKHFSLNSFAICLRFWNNLKCELRFKLRVCLSKRDKRWWTNMLFQEDYLLTVHFLSASPSIPTCTSRCRLIPTHLINHDSVIIFTSENIFPWNEQTLLVTQRMQHESALLPLCKLHLRFSRFCTRQFALQPSAFYFLSWQNEPVLWIQMNFWYHKKRKTHNIIRRKWRTTRWERPKCQHVVIIIFIFYEKVATTGLFDPYAPAKQVFPTPTTLSRPEAKQHDDDNCSGKKIRW